jgi:hypothetical protein
MKRIAFAVLALMLLTSSAWGAAATVTSTEFGYSITGGTSATNIAQDTWVTSTAYVVGDSVIKSSIIYKCQVAHTSGTFAIDLSAAYWVASANATIWVNAISQKAASATDTSTITSGSSGVSALIIPAAAILNTSIIPYSKPREMQNPQITLAAAGDIVYIDIDRKNF